MNRTWLLVIAGESATTSLGHADDVAQLQGHDSAFPAVSPSAKVTCGTLLRWDDVELASAIVTGAENS
jgi:hypothetical protein